MSPLLALGVVGLLQRQRDQAIVVSGQDARPVGVRRARQKIELQAQMAVRILLVERQVKLHQGVEQHMLGDLNLAPGGDIRGVAGVGNGPVMPAGGAIGVGQIGVDHPVADGEFGIGAKTIKLLVDGERPPNALLRVALLLQRRQIHDFGDETRAGACTSGTDHFQNRAIARSAGI